MSDDDVRGFLEEKNVENGDRAKSFARALMLAVFLGVGLLYVVAFLDQTVATRELPDVAPALVDKAVEWEEARFERVRRLLESLTDLALFSVFPYVGKVLGFAIPKRGGGG